MVLVDDRPVRDYPLATLRANIGFVPQETFLFSEIDSREHCFRGAAASTEDVLAAAEAAHIRREFEEFPHGMDTAVGERGLTLSGGQKQRTAIARAVVRDPAILVLDDALASVDTYTEETHPAAIAGGDARPHDDLYLAPHLDGAACGQDCGAGERPDRGAGHA